MIKWYEKTGPEGDVVVSSRIRLARNLRSYPFPVKMNASQRAKVEQEVKDAIFESSTFSQQFRYIDMQELSKTEAVSLVERHLVSPEFISQNNGRALMLAQDESISIMINEEDHLRTQVMQEGLNLEAAYDTADKLDTMLNERLHFAFDENLGYLTQCPTNLGTGMRASLMLHLPALQESGTMNRIANNLTKLGLVLRGTYGEGTESIGALYQLSNQVTLGLSEREAMANLNSIAMQLISQERNTRQALVKNLETQDAICRSVGILKSALMLSNNEFMKLISNVRLGIATGFITNIPYDLVNSMMVQVQPATVMLPTGKNLTPPERDALRAKIVSERLAAVK